ncbi:hypothetical protein [Leptospira sarikeiensis]|uniref:Uncharacterized protein n=1 Tax=Leptospira sarikeiensis TaxID=2484943 RepID=A0A4R9KBZ3_9LEPT|nr:hypothetical protein [Leptospira sarikeiensis]TGL63395.1 hypothetical protein EHQ64_05415 [Leptospira sarikeiensis]
MNLILEISGRLSKCLLATKAAPILKTKPDINGISGKLSSDRIKEVNRSEITKKMQSIAK